jgi:hypothetical protein
MVFGLPMSEAHSPCFVQIAFFYCQSIFPCGRTTRGPQHCEFRAKALEL